MSLRITLAPMTGIRVVKKSSKQNRNMGILMLRIKGISAKDLAAQEGITTQRVHAIISTTAKTLIDEERIHFLTPNQIITDYREKLIEKLINTEPPQ